MTARRDIDRRTACAPVLRQGLRRRPAATAAPRPDQPREVDLEIDPARPPDLRGRRRRWPIRPSGERIFMEMRRLLAPATTPPTASGSWKAARPCSRWSCPSWHRPAGRAPEPPSPPRRARPHAARARWGRRHRRPSRGSICPTTRRCCGGRAGGRWATSSTARPADRRAVPRRPASPRPARRRARAGRVHGTRPDGAERPPRCCARWKASPALRRFCPVLVSEHLRLGFTVRGGRSTAARRTATAGATAPCRSRPC